MLSLRLFEVLSMWLIIRLLPSQDIALVGASLGFIALLNAINFSPYRRIYKSFDALQSRLSEHISSYVMFWAIQSAAMLCLALLAGLFYLAVPELGFKFSVPSDWIVLVKDALAEFALYDHFIGAAIDIINRVF